MLETSLYIFAAVHGYWCLLGVLCIEELLIPTPFVVQTGWCTVYGCTTQDAEVHDDSVISMIHI